MKKSKHSLRVETMKMLGSKDDTPYTNPSAMNNAVTQHKSRTYTEKIPEIDISEDEIPF